MSLPRGAGSQYHADGTSPPDEELLRSNFHPHGRPGERAKRVAGALSGGNDDEDIFSGGVTRDVWNLQGGENGLMNITVRNVPQSVYRVIKREAKKNGRSLDDEIIQILVAVAAEAEHRRRLSGLRKVLERFRAALPPLDDSAPLIRQDRER